MIHGIMGIIREYLIDNLDCCQKYRKYSTLLREKLIELFEIDLHTKLKKMSKGSKQKNRNCGSIYV